MLTHGAGMLFGLTAIIVLMIAGIRTGDPWVIGSFAVYALCMTSSYVTSTFYLSFRSTAPRSTVRRLRRPKGALPPAEKVGRAPAEPTPVPMQKGNTHGRALYACYAFLPLLKNAPMSRMTTKMMR